MEISEIKQKLNIIDVARTLGIQIDRNHRACCPFHDDKTPSLQFSEAKQIATCFSSNCDLGTVDVIGLTERMLETGKHEALKYLTVLAGGARPEGKIIVKPKPAKENYQTDFGQMQSSFISSSTARAYAESRGLNWKQLEIGYNAFKESRFNYLRGCIVFALRDKKGGIVSLYGRSIRDSDKAKPACAEASAGRHYYTANRSGLYPGYPKKETTRLILTEAVIDAATLLQSGEITKEYEVLTLYGTNGLTSEHVKAIQQLESLTEIILFFDGDEAGNEAVERHGKYLKELLPDIQVSVVKTPEGEDINSLSLGHAPELFTELLAKRKLFSFSTETTSSENKKEAVQQEILPKPASALNTSNPYKISYVTETAVYHIKGGLTKALDSMKVTLEIENPETARKSRTKPDLYEDKQVEKVSREAGEKLGLRADLIEQDLNHLTDLLDEYRERQLEDADRRSLVSTATPTILPSEKQRCTTFLNQPGLIQKINQLIEKAGITGESNNRIFLFVIATSYKMPDTLHALIQGSSGSGKTYLARQITDLMPHEDVIRLTRVTENSFYNYGEFELQHKLIVLEDIDGLKEEAEYAFRELQSNNEIISSTSAKDEANGSIKAQIKRVKGPIGSIATTTRGEIYEDNMSRIFLLAVDEGKEQTSRIITYQNQKAAGMINTEKESDTRHFIQNCIRLLKPYPVINPYANKILLPPEAHKIRRLTELYHAFVKQITLINQYQRKRDKQGRLISEKEDLQTACEIMFDSIILKIDELDGSLRQFYEGLKAYVQTKGEEYQNYQFTQLEVRQALNIKKTRLSYYLNELVELEYITQSGYANRGYSYKIAYWDNLQAMRDRIKKNLNDQLEKL